jgi:hypothetical protein
MDEEEWGDIDILSMPDLFQIDAERPELLPPSSPVAGATRTGDALLSSTSSMLGGGGAEGSTASGVGDTTNTDAASFASATRVNDEIDPLMNPNVELRFGLYARVNACE